VLTCDVVACVQSHSHTKGRSRQVCMNRLQLSSDRTSLNRFCLAVVVRFTISSHLVDILPCSIASYKLIILGHETFCCVQSKTQNSTWKWTVHFTHCDISRAISEFRICIVVVITALITAVKSGHVEHCWNVQCNQWPSLTAVITAVFKTVWLLNLCKVRAFQFFIYYPVLFILMH